MLTVGPPSVHAFICDHSGLGSLLHDHNSQDPPNNGYVPCYRVLNLFAIHYEFRLIQRACSVTTVQQQMQVHKGRQNARRHGSKALPGVAKSV
eukprot:1155928-Pelagomonas_calceolata.AAC.1